MPNELPQPLPPKNAGGNSPAQNNAPAGKPASVVATAPVGAGGAPLAQSPALFGGHKGGGKKRADGLVAGSPAAIEKDREKNRLRMAEKRAQEKVANLPPPLPGVSSTSGNPIPALAADSPGLSPVAIDFAPVAAPVAVPLFVAWSEKVLARPVKLLTKIIDRIRVSSLMMRVKKLGLSKEREKELEQKFQYKVEAVNDFNAALANCATIELNKRRVPGAEHGHWLELGLTGGELVMGHIDMMDTLSKAILESEMARIDATAQSHAVAKN